MRVCLIGNSHIAAPKLGWDDIHAQFPGVEIVFFAAQGQTLAGAQLRDGVLSGTGQVHCTSGETAIRLADYDAIFLVGLAYGIMQVLRLYHRFRTEEHNGRASAGHLVSPDCFSEACLGLLNDSLAAQIGRRIMAMTRAKVALCPQPMPSEQILDAPKGRLAKAAVDCGDEAALARTFELTSKKMSDSGMHVMPQPAETLVRPIFTAKCYSVGSTRIRRNFSVPHGDDDFAHMNREYGAIIIRKMIDGLGS